MNYLKALGSTLKAKQWPLAQSPKIPVSNAGATPRILLAVVHPTLPSAPDSVPLVIYGITFVGKGNLDGSAVLGVCMAVRGGGQEWVIS